MSRAWQRSCHEGSALRSSLSSLVGNPLSSVASAVHEPHDFAAVDGEVKVGRIYMHDTHGGPANWFWAMAIGPGINRVSNCSGTIATKAEAVRLAEEVVTGAGVNSRD